MTAVQRSARERDDSAATPQEIGTSWLGGIVIGFTLIYLLIKLDLANPNRRYMREAMKRATYERIEDDGSWYGEIPGFDGVWANAPTREDCVAELGEVLEGWIELRRSRGLPLPPASSSHPVAA